MIFLDTSAIYAMANTRDPHHVEARQGFALAIESSEQILTHSYVLSEAIALLQNRLGLAPALAFESQRIALQIHWIGLVEHEQAIAFLRERSRRAVSLVDCASFVVMRNYGISAALAFDAHFWDEGFKQYGV